MGITDENPFEWGESEAPNFYPLVTTGGELAMYYDALVLDFYNSDDDTISDEDCQNLKDMLKDGLFVTSQVRYEFMVGEHQSHVTIRDTSQYVTFQPMSEGVWLARIENPDF